MNNNIDFYGSILRDSLLFLVSKADTNFRAKYDDSSEDEISNVFKLVVRSKQLVPQEMHTWLQFFHSLPCEIGSYDAPLHIF